ncbi:MAG: NAD kinase [Bradyrhizobiaceae bacterium]|nr:NAD kinase [Bradyrhizobiaceae bacterium]
MNKSATRYDKIAFIASAHEEAAAARRDLAARYGEVSIDAADVVVALGGDGLMLQALHELRNKATPIYGMNRGSVGFLMNEYRADGLKDRLADAERVVIHPLIMEAVSVDGKKQRASAFNEVSLLRQSYQAAKLRIAVDGKVRLAELICDGILVATPVGSTAYNLSAHGPILPVNAPLLALTPLSAFRPRRWRGALLPDKAEIEIAVLEADKRPVSAVADHFEVRSVATVTVRMDMASSTVMLFDPGHSLDERILAEQFG